MELMRDLRSNGLLLAAKVITLTLIALAIYGYGTFVQSTTAAVDRSLSGRADVDLYTLIDRFTADPDGFERFRESPAQLRRVADFVERLDDTEGIRFVSSYDQPVPVSGFRGDERFDVGYGTEYSIRGEYPDESGRTVRDVKSLQMNEAAFEFAGLRISSGAVPDWDSVDYRARTVPVLLGADYSGIYGIGDTLDASLLFRDVRLVVVGLLEPDSSMYFRGEINHFVDDTVLLPYPSALSSLIDDDPDFAGMLAFQILNADLAVRPSLTLDDLLGRLDRISVASGFADYSLTGVPTYVVQLSQVRRLVQDNLSLLSSLLVLLVVAGVVATAFVDARLAHRRRPVWRAHQQVGRDARHLVRLWAPSWVLEHAAVFVGFAVGCAVLPNQNAIPFLVVAALLGVCATIDGLAQRHAVVASSSTVPKGRP